MIGYKYVSKTNEEIREIVKAMAEGRIFGSWMMQPSEDPSTVFMPLALLTDQQLAGMKAQGVLHIYEFMDKPKLGAGYPTFASARFLSALDCKRVDEESKK